MADGQDKKKDDAQRTDGAAATAEDKPKTKPAGRELSTGRVFWGLLLVVIGVLALLDSFDVVDVSLTNLWRLWPLVIVGLGLSIIRLSGWVSRLVTVLFMIAVLAGVIFVGLDTRSEPEVQTQTVDVEQQEGATTASINLEAGAGKVAINPSSSELLAAARLDSNFAELESESRLEDGRQVVDLSTEGSFNWFRGDPHNSLTLDLSPDLPLELSIDTGAADVSGDLSSLMVARLDIDTGASSVDLRLGDRVETTEITVDAGASSINLAVPESSGVRVEMEGGLSSINLPGLGEVEDGVRQTDDFEAAEHQIVIRGDIGVASFDLERY